MALLTLRLGGEGQEELEAIRVDKSREVHADDSEVVMPRSQGSGVCYVDVGAVQVTDVDATDAANVRPGGVEPDGDAPQGARGLRSHQLYSDWP